MRKKLLYLASLVLVFSGLVGLLQTQIVGAGGHRDDPVTPTPPSFVDPTCETGGTYTIPYKHHVTYKVKTSQHGNYSPKSAGTYPIETGKTVYIKADASNGYYINGNDDWEHKFKLDKECVQPAEVTFVDPTCEAGGTYTIPYKKGVFYKVNGAFTWSGTYQATEGESLVIQAFAVWGYELTGTTQWSHEFVVNEECEEEVANISYEVVCTEDGAKVTLSNTGNIAGDVTLNGEVITVEAGETVERILSTGDNGLQITIIIGEKTVYDQLVDCKAGEVLGDTTVDKSDEVLVPAVLPTTSGDSTVATVTVLSSLGAFLGLLSFAVRSVLTRQI